VCVYVLFGHVTQLVLDAAYCYRCGVVCLLGGVNRTKTDEMIEMSFVDSGGPKLGYHVLGGARIPPGEGSVFWGWHLPVS